MKYNNIIFLVFTTLLIGVLSDVDVNVYGSQEFTGSNILDIAGVNVFCPYNGAMKNFKIVQSGSKMKFEMLCYSSKSAISEYDEAILKDLRITRSTSKVSCSKSLNSISSLEVKCPVDYAINSFELTTDISKTSCQFDYSCVGIKPQDDNLYSGSTDKKSGDLNSLNLVTNVECGSKESETSKTATGFALNSFKFNADFSSVGFNYKYQKLRNIKSFKDDQLNKAKAQRDGNDQKN